MLFTIDTTLIMYENKNLLNFIHNKPTESMEAAEPAGKPTLEGSPQQNHFAFGDVVFSSEFDSGNLQNVVRIDDLNVLMFVTGN